MAPPTRTSVPDQLLPLFHPETAPSCTLVSTITPGLDPSDTPPPPIAEHGPSLSNGITTVDDASFTTRIQVHSGPSASSRYSLVALLDTGSLQAFISAEAGARIKHNSAGSDACERHAPPRSWGGFGKSPSILTSTSDRLSIQFLHGDTPVAELAAWVCIVPAGTMQHPVLLGRDGWMRLTQRTHTILPRQPSQPIFDDHPLSVPRTKGLSTFISDHRPTADTSHLKFAGVYEISLSSTLFLVPVNLVRPSGIPALTGHYLVDMLPSDGALSETETLVADGYQTFPLSGSTDLEPGELLGPLLLPSYQFRHGPYSTLPRNQYPPHPRLRFHHNRAVYPRYWLEWAHPT